MSGCPLCSIPTSLLLFPFFNVISLPFSVEGMSGIYTKQICYQVFNILYNEKKVPKTILGNQFDIILLEIVEIGILEKRKKSLVPEAGS